MAAEFLPESRTRDRKGAIQTADGWLIPIFCANCCKPWGNVNEKDITFAFCLCDSCVEKHGAPAHLRMEPDSVFWERVSNEHKERAARGDPLTPIVLARELEDPSSVVSKLAAEWRAHVRKVA